ncbi:hypothetical protein, partial [Paraburkholderia hospita]|uniref:hypothetical protein n=1 Tax=Paraburkholderia hospita TaxID=169430 RepID=UPI001EE664C6
MITAERASRFKGNPLLKTRQRSARLQPDTPASNSSFRLLSRLHLSLINELAPPPYFQASVRHRIVWPVLQGSAPGNLGPDGGR